MANEQWVWMTHPDLETEPAKVTAKAFNEVWSDKGWTIVDDSEVPSEVPTNTRNTTLDDEPNSDYDFQEVE